MKIQEFDKWLACYLQQSESEVTKLLGDITATRFLIAWSLLETSCFQGFAKLDKINGFADQKALDPNLNLDKLDVYVEFFHDRYQKNINFYRNLMHKAKCKSMDAVMEKSFAELSSVEKIFFVTVVVFRYRNNIFHGNKGVDSWLLYKECILKCIAIIQLLIPMPANELSNS